MPDFNEPDVQKAAFVFGYLCLVMTAVMGFLSPDPAVALKAGGILALVSTLVLVLRAKPSQDQIGEILPLQVRNVPVRRRAGIGPRVRAHLWFAQWTAALSMASLALALLAPA
jgi:hypothetical protein